MQCLLRRVPWGDAVKSAVDAVTDAAEDEIDTLLDGVKTGEAGEQLAQSQWEQRGVSRRQRSRRHLRAD
jgi:hypothetical protein